MQVEQHAAMPENPYQATLGIVALFGTLVGLILLGSAANEDNPTTAASLALVGSWVLGVGLSGGFLWLVVGALTWKAPLVAPAPAPIAPETASRPA